MNGDEIDAKYGPLVKTYQDKIEMLSNQISKLEDVKRELDTKVANHTSTTIDYQKSQVVLSEILKDIEVKQIVQKETTEAMNVLNAKKFELEQAVEKLNIEVNTKNEYIADIEKYSYMVAELQEEMAKFQDAHAENKKTAQAELDEIKKQLADFHTAVGLIVNK